MKDELRIKTDGQASEFSYQDRSTGRGFTPFRILNTLLFLTIVVEVVICAEYFFSGNLGYLLDSAAILLTFLGIRLADYYLRELTSSFQLSVVLLIPFFVFTLLTKYSLENRPQNLLIHGMVVDGRTEAPLNSVEIRSLSRPGTFWESNSQGQFEISLDEVQRKKAIVLYLFSSGYKPEKIVIEPDQIEKDIVLNEAIKLRDINSKD